MRLLLRLICLLALLLLLVPLQASPGLPMDIRISFQADIQPEDAAKLSPDERRIVLEAMALGWESGETQACLDARRQVVARAFGDLFASRYGRIASRLHEREFLRYYREVMGLAPTEELPAGLYRRYQESGRAREEETRRRMRPVRTDIEQRGFEALAVEWDNPHESTAENNSRRRDAVRAFGPDWVEEFEESNAYARRDMLEERYLQAYLVEAEDNRFDAALRYLESYGLSARTDVGYDICQRLQDSWRERRAREGELRPQSTPSEPKSTAEQEKRALATHARRIGLRVFYGLVGLLVGGYALFRFACLSKHWSVLYWASFLAVLLLLVAVGGGNWNGHGWPWGTFYKLPGGYILFLRLAVTVLCGWQVYLAARTKAHPLLILASVALCILYQPVMEVKVEREYTCWMHLLSAVFLGAYPCLLRVTQKEDTPAFVPEARVLPTETLQVELSAESRSPHPETHRDEQRAAAETVAVSDRPDVSVGGVGSETEASSTEDVSTPEPQEATPRSFLWTLAYFATLSTFLGVVAGLSGYSLRLGALWMLLLCAVSWGLKRWLETSAVRWRIGLYCLGAFWFFIIVVCGGATLIFG